MPWKARQLHDVLFSSEDVPALLGLWMRPKPVALSFDPKP
eukprot:CAMPEP_0173381660 /NCGR_PEP_ID=MMETSP1356-20130122/4049_1 /TAXON_ID=77927 ORGANISM="Hemiselmis virescens, Strain PCC157" /NCGR_SAMPLE_ID=MMETSP1356 /ASSEMBLY_ACC=CAM_ASM_000847 /LENGTH=39 /DNA_ID= /DNA_START= /DNA_END= /DNA_ORIENTATION=